MEWGPWKLTLNRDANQENTSNLIICSLRIVQKNVIFKNVKSLVYEVNILEELQKYLRNGKKIYSVNSYTVNENGLILLSLLGSNSKTQKASLSHFKSPKHWVTAI